MDDLKICALIRQSWYETAKRNLNEQERLSLYECCFNYQFYDKDPVKENLPTAAVMIMFDLIRPILAEDREKARNIAERNRQNGRKGGRPPKDNTMLQDITENTKPKETQKNPAVNLAQQYTIYNNTTLQNTTFFISADEKENTYTKKILMIIFFELGAPDPLKEASRFWNYYEARGWKLPNGSGINNIFALAKSWRIENEDPGLRTTRKTYAGLLNYIAEKDNNFPYNIISDYQSTKTSSENKTITLTFYGARAETYFTSTALEITQRWIDERLPIGWQIQFRKIPIIE